MAADDSPPRSPVLTAQDTLTSSPLPEQTPVQLRYPTIKLHTSFESLLSHSSSSPHPPVTMPSQATPMPALDESWASLDTSDFSQDDDVQSEANDAGSLVDLSSVQDTESAVEEDEQSEVDLDKDTTTSIVAVGSSHGRGEATSHGNTLEDEESMEDTIMLQRSEVQSHADAINLEYTRQLGSTTSLGHPTEHLPVQETIKMTVSNQSLDTIGGVFTISYYGAASASDTKAELLGKIGAALASSASSSSSRSASYNVVPTEFGPGAKPTFAELIPSQAWLLVDDIAILKPDMKHPADINFSYKGAAVWRSTKTSSIQKTPERCPQPDLLVVQLSRDDVAEDFFTASEVLEIARRHCWPTITVTKDPINGLAPMYHRHGITITRNLVTRDSDTKGMTMQPVDLESFMALDSSQLNHHLKHISEKAEKALAARDSRHKSKKTTGTFLSSIFGEASHHSVGSTKTEYTLTRVDQTEEAKELSAVIVEQKESQSIVANIRQLWSRFDGSGHMKDIFLTWVAVTIGIYLANSSLFSQISPSKIGATNLTADNFMDSAVPVPATAASLAIPVPTTEALSMEHDIVVYDATTFDQMWQRLTGRSSNEPTELGEEVIELIKEEGEETNIENDQEPRGPGRFFKQLHQGWRNGIRSRFERAHVRLLEDIEVRKARQEESKEKLQSQIGAMHRKLQVLWNDISHNVGGLEKHSRKHLFGLLESSRQHVRRARWAGEQHLAQLVADQKHVLAQAQHQARILASQAATAPKHKKNCDFGCGRKRSFFRKL